jgi:RNA polymerase sigma-70 factor (ECF subfamily)
MMTGEAAAVGTAHDEARAAAADRLGTLFDVHHQRLYRLARRLSGSADEARDLVQDTFLRAARAPASVPSGASAEEAWLVRVLVNLCRDRWPQTANRERLRLRHGYGRHVDRAASPTSVELSDPEAALVARSVVWRALATLDPRRRAVLVMHELEGVPVDAIARTLGVTAVTVRWHLSKGRRQLAAAIRGGAGHRELGGGEGRTS